MLMRLYELTLLARPSDESRERPPLATELASFPPFPSAPKAPNTARRTLGRGAFRIVI